MYLLFIGVFVVSAISCHMLARRKGRESLFWGMMGAIFGPLAFLVLLVMPKSD